MTNQIFPQVKINHNFLRLGGRRNPATFSIELEPDVYDWLVANVGAEGTDWNFYTSAFDPDVEKHLDNQHILYFNNAEYVTLFCLTFNKRLQSTSIFHHPV